MKTQESISAGPENDVKLLAPQSLAPSPSSADPLPDKLAKRREHYAKNKPLMQERARDDRRRNKERLSERNKKRYAKNNGKVAARKRNLVKRFGITWGDYRNMWCQQGGCCAVCGRHQKDLSKALAVDHNHQTTKVRGLLCGDCNTGIGLLNDDSTLLRQAADYLDKWKEAANN